MKTHLRHARLPNAAACNVTRGIHAALVLTDERADVTCKRCWERVRELRRLERIAISAAALKTLARRDTEEVSGSKELSKGIE